MEKIPVTSLGDMRPLHTTDPDLTTVEEVVAFLDSDRPLLPEGRPWVTTNMVMSLDGAYSTGGRSGGLSSEADRALFLALRSLVDVILVGASTVRAENYRRASVGADAAAIRQRRGQEPAPRIVITSRGLELPADTPLLDGGPPLPIMVHPLVSDTSAAPDGVELMCVGENSVDFEKLLQILYSRGARHVLCEGGPGVLGQLATHGLIDEYMLTVSPRLIGGRDVGLLSRSSAADADLALHRTLVQDDHLMLCYRRR